MSLLATKLHMPASRPGQVPRPRLTARLDEGLARGLMLACAPAGYGKTVLLADWARRGGRPAGWLSLDAGITTRPGSALSLIAAVVLTDAFGLALAAARKHVAVSWPAAGNRDGLRPTHLGRPSQRCHLRGETTRVRQLR